jgi:hypothetical protein
MHCLIYVVMLTFEPFIMFVLFIILFFGIEAPSHLPIYKMLLQFGLLQPHCNMSLLLHLSSCHSLSLHLII